MKKQQFFPVKLMVMLQVFCITACMFGEGGSPDPTPQNIPPAKDSPVHFPFAPVSSADFPFSDLGGGKLLYESNSETFGSFVLANMSNKTITKFRLEGLNMDSQISPDGEFIVYSARTDLTNPNHEFGIYVSQSDGKASRRIISTTTNGFNPSWTPDSKKIIFWSRLDPLGSSLALYSVNKDGTNLTKHSNQTTSLLFSSPSISGNGQMTFCTNMGSTIPGKESGVYLFDPVTQKFEPIIPSEPGKFFESPTFSPDGSKIAFLQVTRVSEEYKLIEIILWNVISKTSTVLTSVTASGSKEYNLAADLGNQVNLAWSPDGGKLIFNVPEGNFTSHLYVVNSDGTSLKKITNGSNTTDNKVSWGR